MTQLLIRWSVLALGVTIATEIVSGISYDNFGTLIVVVLVLSLFNAVLKPLMLLFTLPFIVLTLGFGVLLINALLFLLVGRVVDGFHVAGFWSALGGALIVSLTNLIMSRFLPGKPRAAAGTPAPVRRGKPGKAEKPDDVIDI